MASSRRSATESAPRTRFTCPSILTPSTQPVSLFLFSSHSNDPVLTNNVDIVAPATGTPETGGWSTRELRTILRGLDGLNFIGADIVEVAPAYDTNAEHTTMAAADALYEVMTMMVKKGPLTVADSEEL